MKRKPPVPNTIGEEFMEFTRYEYLGPSDQTLGQPPPDPESPVPMIRGAVSAGTTVQLPPPEDSMSVVPHLDATHAITSRRSIRSYRDAPVSIMELSYLLWVTDGVKEARGIGTLRTAPSAGARHPLEAYLMINRVEGVAPGLYRYIALGHKLVSMDLSPEVGPRVMEGFMDQGMVIDSAFTLIWTAVPYRSAWRYGQRAYRYIHLDAGHACENLYIAAPAVGCGCCAMAAFEDDFINSLLGLDGSTEFVIYAASVGKVR